MTLPPVNTVQHTDGPWTVDDTRGRANNLLRVVDRNGRGVANINATLHAAPNARLIASAPELLAALKALDAYWLDSLPDGPDGSRTVMSGIGTIADDTIAIWKQARAAISKATGQ